MRESWPPVLVTQLVTSSSVSLWPNENLGVSSSNLCEKKLAALFLVLIAVAGNSPLEHIILDRGKPPSTKESQSTLMMRAYGSHAKVHNWYSSKRPTLRPASFLPLMFQRGARISAQAAHAPFPSVSSNFGSSNKAVTAFLIAMHTGK